jgi:hypothetical protein
MKEFEESFALQIEPFDEVFQSAEIKNSSAHKSSSSSVPELIMSSTLSMLESRCIMAIKREFLL